MTTIIQRMDSALSTISPAIPYAYAPYKGDLPNLFIAFQLLPSPPVQHADNKEKERFYTFQVSIWDKAGNPSETSVDTALLAAGFMKGNVIPLLQDPKTHHYGLAVEYTYLEQKE